MPDFRSFRVTPRIPERLTGLMNIAMNYRWCWDREAIALFRRLDRALWEKTYQNPLRMLGAIDQQAFDEKANDDSFVNHLDQVQETLNEYMNDQRTWFTQHHGESAAPQYAYFSLEFGIAESLPIYSGGLGVLAGDHLKSASDLGVPLAAVGLAYRLGYFRQYLNADGWQLEMYPENDFYNMSMSLCEDDQGSPLQVAVQLPDGPCRAQIWHCQVGRVSLYMLDANIPENPPHMREITNQLYVSDREARIRQEILLGIGGIRALEKLGVKPTVYHMNEGHSAFLALERLRHCMEQENLKFDEALLAVSAGSVFTTHTPVPAGNETFSPELIINYLGEYCSSLKIDNQRLLGLGRQNPHDEHEPFCMTVLAMRCADFCNGVSKLHGQVSRGMWSPIWPDLPRHEVPITSITNGIHTRTWISSDMSQLYDRYLGPRWISDPGDKGIWARAETIPDAELWRTHERRRERLVAFARRRLRSQLDQRGAAPVEIEAAEEVLDPEALTIGFARRFATYKRGNLIFRNQERLAQILSDTDRPVQLIIAGKSHPADNEAKKLISDIIHVCHNEPFHHYIVFLEDYDMKVARYLVQGVDLWLNTPLRPMEASGTSGMKAAANGVLNMSVPDGWWDEVDESHNGFDIGKGESYESLELQNEVESNAIYDLLEKQVIPMFYDRGRDGLPREWIRYMKNNLKTICPIFSSNRMVREYTERFYLKAAERYRAFSANDFANTKELAKWLRDLSKKWSAIKVLSLNADTERSYAVGDRVSLEAEIDVGGLKPQNLAVEVYYGTLDTAGKVSKPVLARLNHGEQSADNRYLFKGEMNCENSGQYGFAIRVLPNHPDLATPFLPGFIIWG